VRVSEVVVGAAGSLGLGFPAGSMIFSLKSEVYVVNLSPISLRRSILLGLFEANTI